MDKTTVIRIKQISLYYLKNKQELKIKDKKDKYLKKNKNKAWLSIRLENLIEKVTSNIKQEIYMEESHIKKDTVRTINNRYKDSYIALAECDLTRMLGIVSESNSLIQVIANNKNDRKIAKDIIENGFYYGNIKYTYLFSSAGMTRDCKLLFIKKTDFKKIHDKLYCGLSKAIINTKGGINVNKFLAYLSLCKTSSSVWNGFNIDKAIVVKDFKTMVKGEFDCINTEDGTITREYREIPYNVTDGFGIVQADTRKKSCKNFQFRLPFFKGLLSEFDIKGYIIEYNLNPVVTDIWGHKHNILENGIQYIFTESQFKMWSYYDSWEQYKKYFKQYGCNASICKDDSSVKTKAMLNYQILQDMSFTDSELNTLLAKDLKRLREAHTVEKQALKLIQGSFGLVAKAYELYPELLHSGRVHKLLNKIIESKKMDLALGGITIDGSYLFVIPDITAWLQELCSGNKDNGILSKNNCYTRVFKESKVVLERSPHLDRSHCISNNDYNNKDCQKWFKSNGIYTSIYDSYFQALCYDNDGDHLLVITDKTFFKVAKRAMENIRPLYYEMKKAPKQRITKDNIFKSLKKSWSINIGMCSNKITKHINSLDHSITNEEYKVVQLYTCYNNFLIDYAKSGYLPPFIKRLPKIDNKVMPYFFKYKKDYDKPFEKVPNSYNVMDRIVNMIYTNDRTEYNFPLSQNFKFENLLSIQKVSSKKSEIKKEVISRYKALSREKLNSDDISTRAIFYKNLRNILLDRLDITIEEVLCVLVRFIYNTKEGLNYSEKFLWNCFGTELLANLEKNLEGTKICPICNKRFKPSNNRQVYCSLKCKNKVNRKK